MEIFFFLNFKNIQIFIHLRPKFKYVVMNPDSGYSRIKVTWQPQIEGNPGKVQ